MPELLAAPERLLQLSLVRSTVIGPIVLMRVFPEHGLLLAEEDRLIKVHLVDALDEVLLRADSLGLVLL